MIDNGVVDNKMFSFYMDRNNNGDTSSVTFGGYDSSLKKGDIHWHSKLI